MQNYWENLTLGKNIREKVHNISEIAECRKVPYLVSSFNAFLPNVDILYFLPISCLGFPGAFRGYTIKTLAKNWLN